MKRYNAYFLAITLIILMTIPTRSQNQDRFTGSWAGTLNAGGQELRTVFHIQKQGDSLSATMDSPDQGAKGIPVARVHTKRDSLTLRVKVAGGTYKGLIKKGDTVIEGNWEQRGRSFPLTLSPASEADMSRPARPQHPEPPYPYKEEKLRIQHPDAGFELTGTLTLPEGDGPFPGLVLVSGSGPQSRDSKVAGHKLFHVLADHLTRQGFAVLRYDERGVGESGGSFEGATTKDLAGDAAAVVRKLREHASIDQEQVGILGMSEGGLIAPMVHDKMEQLDFMVLMGGPAVPGSKILVEQKARIVSASAPGVDPDSIRKAQRELMAAVKKGEDSASVAEHAKPILKEQGLAGDRLNSQLAQLTSPWFRYFVNYDPKPSLEKVDVPTLALYGSKDLQVPPQQNAEPMQNALGKSPSEDFTVKTLEGLNHLMQPAETGSPNAYSKIETTMDPKALEAVSGWLRERTEP